VVILEFDGMAGVKSEGGPSVETINIKQEKEEVREASHQPRDKVKDGSKKKGSKMRKMSEAKDVVPGSEARRACPCQHHLIHHIDGTTLQTPIETSKKNKKGKTKSKINLRK
jgi:hypothetical protein